MAAVGHYGCPKFTFDRISGNFRSICTTLFCLEIFDKMVAVSHFVCPKFTFDRISGHFRSICTTLFCLEILLPIGHFRSNGIFFWNFLQNGRRRTFWISKITFYCISGHFRSIGHFGCLKFTLDSNSGHLRSIQNFFGGHFGCPKITFDRISGHFRSIGHFGCPKFTFNGISGSLFLFFVSLTKWPLAAILDVHCVFMTHQ